MTIVMDDKEVTTLEQIRQVLVLGRSLVFKATDRRERYAWIESVLRRLGYFKLNPDLLT